MENIKGKIFAGIGIVVVIAVFFIIFWLLLYQISDEKSLVLSKNILQNKKCWFIIISDQRD